MQVQVNHTKKQSFCLFPVLCLKKKKDLYTIPRLWAFEKGVSLTMREKLTSDVPQGHACMHTAPWAFFYCHNCCHHRLIKPPPNRPCRRRGWDLCVYVCMHKNKIKKLWHHCHEQLILSTPPREVGLNITHKSSDSSKHNSKDSNNGSKAKTIKGTWKHSKEKGFSMKDLRKFSHKPKSRESFVFTKAPLMSPLTLQELPCRQLGHLIFHQWLPSISNWKEGLSTRHGLANLQKVKTICW